MRDISAPQNSYLQETESKQNFFICLFSINAKCYFFETE